MECFQSVYLQAPDQCGDFWVEKAVITRVTALENGCKTVPILAIVSVEAIGEGAFVDTEETEYNLDEDRDRPYCRPKSMSRTG